MSAFNAGLGANFNPNRRKPTVRTPIDISKIKPGDEVTVRLEFAAGPPMKTVGWAKLIDTAGDIHELPTDCFVTHTPTAIAVGDRVGFISNPTSLGGVVRHILDGNAWVEWSPRSSPAYHEVLPVAGLEVRS